MGPLSSSRLVASGGERLGFIFQTMKRESVKIWAGWLESIDNIPDRKSGAELALAIFEYALDGRDYTGSDPWVKVLLPTIKKTIDHSLQNAENGGKGGRRKAENLKAATSTATSTANDTKDVDVDVDNRHKTKDNNIDDKQKNNQEKAEPSSSPTTSKNFKFKEYLLEHGASEQAVIDWLEVRKKKKAANTLTAIRTLEREAKKAGISLADAVELCAGNSWQSLKAEWIEKESAAPEESEYMKAMNAQVRRQREIDAEIEAERQRRMRENK